VKPSGSARGRCVSAPRDFSFPRGPPRLRFLPFTEGMLGQTLSIDALLAIRVGVILPKCLGSVLKIQCNLAGAMLLFKTMQLSEERC
jgi:hypothetical protein